MQGEAMDVDQAAPQQLPITMRTLFTLLPKLGIKREHGASGTPSKTYTKLFPDQHLLKW